MDPLFAMRLLHIKQLKMNESSDFQSQYDENLSSDSFLFSFGKMKPFYHTANLLWRANVPSYSQNHFWKQAHSRKIRAVA